MWILVSVALAAAAVVFRSRRLAPWLMLTAFAALGAFSFIAAEDTRPLRIKNLYDRAAIASGAPVVIEGTLIRAPEPTYDGFILALSVGRLFHREAIHEALGVVRLYTRSESQEVAAVYESLGLRYGTRVRVAVSLLREESYQNPGVTSRIELLDRAGVDAIGTLKSPTGLEVLDGGNPYSPFSFVYEIRNALIHEFRDRFSVSTAGVLNASLLGDKYFLDKKTADAFREGGTFHVLVISGLHITFIGGLILFFVRRFTKNRLWNFAIAVAVLWSFTFAVGAEIPVMRAGIMFTVLLFSTVIHRDRNLLNSLGACALILLAWRPHDLFNPSFQLTFLSVGAIVAAAFPLIETLRKIGRWTPTVEHPFPPNVPYLLRRSCEALYWRERVWKIEMSRQIWSGRLRKFPGGKWRKNEILQSAAAYITEGIIVSLIVQIFLLPLLVVYFHRISGASVLLNLWVGILLAFESFAAVAAVAVGQISGSLALPLQYLVELLNGLLLVVPNLLIDTDWASVRVPVYSGPLRAVYAIYFCPLFLLVWLLWHWRPFAVSRGRLGRQAFAGLAALLMILGAVIAFHPLSAPVPDGKLRVDFLDVGQGDSALVTFPGGTTMLVDGGGRIDFSKERYDRKGFDPDMPRIGEMVVSEFLWERGYSRIDLILATHADVDHIQGLEDVAKNFQISEALVTPGAEGDLQYSELLSELAKRSVPVISVSAGMEFEIEGVRVEVLHPWAAASGTSDNNASAVIRLTFGERSILMTGDIEREAERQLLERDLSADVVKVPHHGSRTSSTREFVEAVMPSEAVITAGRRSVFGHPHAEVRERWAAAGARVLQAGDAGTISVITDGTGMELGEFGVRE